MTLISTASSPKGFAISADGLEICTGSGEIILDVQKIFSTPFANGTGFAWAWIGDVEVKLASGLSYNLKDITHRIMSELPEDAYSDDPHSYFRRIADRIFYELPTDRYISGLHTTDDELIFVGYLAGEPLTAEIIFQHRDGQFVSPAVLEPQIAPRDFYAFAGSNTICKQMMESGKLSQPWNLEEAINAVRSYAEACVNGQASVPDCRYFGGHIHVATVTKDGFEWIVAPIKPLSI
jgi:hypothetical protein